jgi:hypothetical protein
MARRMGLGIPRLLTTYELICKLDAGAFGDEVLEGMHRADHIFKNREFPVD